MKFQLKFDYCLNSVGKYIYTYKISQVKYLSSNNIDIRDKAREILQEIFSWAVSNRIEIIFHKDEQYVSQTLLIYFHICMTKEIHSQLNKLIINKNKFLKEVSKIFF